MKQLFSSLTDDTDDETVTSIVRFALQSVGTDAKRLRVLVVDICNMPTASGTFVANLLLKLYKHVPKNISDITVRKPKMLRGKQLCRWLVLDELQHTFEDTIASFSWSDKMIDILAALHQNPELFVSDAVVGSLPRFMVDSEHLFVSGNFEIFVKACLTYGPKLDKQTKLDHFTDCINKVSARASTQSITCKMAIAGLIATRENGWVLDTNTYPRVLTPDSGSVVGSETIM